MGNLELKKGLIQSIKDKKVRLDLLERSLDENGYANAIEKISQRRSNMFIAGKISILKDLIKDEQEVLSSLDNSHLKNAEETFKPVPGEVYVFRDGQFHMGVLRVFNKMHGEKFRDTDASSWNFCEPLEEAVERIKRMEE